MSDQNIDPIKIAHQAEKDLNSQQAKQGHSGSDSTLESGVDDSVTSKFPGSTVQYGSSASGAGDNREIPESEGGGINKVTGQPLKAKDFEGEGGPEDKARIAAEAKGGTDGVKSNPKEFLDERREKGDIGEREEQ
ncbi:hypothetical protein EJ08DRAFT_642552 [Tothia fuscella]|uniref:Uncharacterized protein n=1 Tax=Tothia fuscella TaxID=1048955 RepID=A0A9P4NG14_9PEZI|nr:hypothetical protein EJ08DRAFT_642552 [Tothia fuscella]